MRKEIGSCECGKMKIFMENIIEKQTPTVSFRAKVWRYMPMILAILLFFVSCLVALRWPYPGDPPEKKPVVIKL